MPDIGVSKESLKQLVGLSGDFVGTTDTQALTGKTYNVDLNTLTSNTPALGNILKGDGTKLVPFARGTANQALKTNTGGTDIDYGALPVGGGGTGLTSVAVTGILKGTGGASLTTVAAPVGAILGDNDTQTVSGPTTFLDQRLKLRNVANTFSLTIVNPAITANRNLTVPTITADDVLVTQAFAQTLTNKRFDDAIKAKPITSPTTDASYGQFYCDSADTNKPKFKKPDGSVIDLAAAASGAQLNVANVWTEPQTTDKDLQHLLVLYRNSTALGNVDIEFDRKTSSGVRYASGFMGFADTSNTAGAQSSLFHIFQKDAGADINPLRIEAGGVFACGGPNTRVALSESGLSTRRTFTFPDATGRVVINNVNNQFSAEQWISTNAIQTVLQLIRTTTVGDAMYLEYDHNNASGTKIDIGYLGYNMHTVTAGAEGADFMLWVRGVGSLINPLVVAADGTLYCGGPNRRILLSESGLTAQRGFTFPDATTKLAGVSVANQFTTRQTFQYDGGNDTIILYKNSNVTDSATGIVFDQADTTPTLQAYGAIFSSIANGTAGSRSGYMMFQTPVSGTFGTRMLIAADGQVRVGYTAGLQNIFDIYRPSNSGGIAMTYSAANTPGSYISYCYSVANITNPAAGAESGDYRLWLMSAGTLKNVLSVSAAGTLYLGPNQRASLTDTGLTAIRDFTLPDLGGQLATINNTNVFTTQQQIATNVDEVLLKLHRQDNAIFSHNYIQFYFNNSVGSSFPAGHFGYEIANNTSGSESTDFYLFNRLAGAYNSPFAISSTGALYCGGPNRRVILDETGLTGQRTFTFPDTTTKLIGASTQNLFAAGVLQIFRDNTIAITNPADSFSYRIRTSAITADRDLTLPLINGPDTVAVTSLAQSISNKTMLNVIGLSFADAANVTFGTSTGTKLGTTTGQKVAFFNAAPVGQQTGIADVATNTVDATYDSNEQTVITSLRTKVNAILAVLEAMGFTAVA